MKVVGGGKACIGCERTRESKGEKVKISAEDLFATRLMLVWTRGAGAAARFSREGGKRMKEEEAGCLEDR
jgi:hypothetical protein